MGQDGPKMAQDGAKTRWPQERPQDGPRWLQDGPRWPQARPKTAQEGARMAPSRVLSRSYLHLLFGFLQIPAQSSSKTLPGPPQDPKRGPPRTTQEGPPDAPKRPLRGSRSSPQIAGNGGGGYSPSGVLDNNMYSCWSSYQRLRESPYRPMF